MTLRTRSVRRQRQTWACLALLGAVAYFVLVHAFELGNPLLFFGSHQMRVLVPLVIFLRWLAWECRWDGIVRETPVEIDVRGQEGRGDEKADGESRSSMDTQSSVNADPRGNDCGASGDRSQLRQDASDTANTVHCQPQPSPTTTATPFNDANGEEFFAQARALPHQEIPDFEFDGQYLDLLGRSAAAGYAPALAKLGEYAMRRAAWVEAYYWMSMAKRRGMLGLANVMREIRKNWSSAGFPDENENVNPLFAVEDGSLGRALLHIDSGREAAKAKEYLDAIHPGFLSSR